MDKNEFMDFLDFPIEWLDFGLYPDELFEEQMSQMLKELSEEDKKDKLHLKKYGLGSEHYRYGAFWWVVKNIGYSALDKLEAVIEKDIDEPMRWAAINELAKLKKQ
ncbi:MAG: hypothetical protein FWE32_07180 [Oscillospiraceae bacterium]|nr:hypothetical protein [Oscillospiraceae bacterium]